MFIRTALVDPDIVDHDRAIMSIPTPDACPFTERQGQYLAFIDAYTKVNGRPPAEADLQRYFRVSAPTVHQAVLRLERSGLIARTPGQPRSIRVLLDANSIPKLR